MQVKGMTISQVAVLVCFACTVKPVLSGHSKRGPNIVFKTDYRLI